MDALKQKMYGLLLIIIGSVTIKMTGFNISMCLLALLIIAPGLFLISTRERIIC